MYISVECSNSSQTSTELCMNFEKEYMSSGGEIWERSGKISWRSQDGIWEDDEGFDGQRTGNAILEKANSTSGAPGSGGSEHISGMASHGVWLQCRLHKWEHVRKVDWGTWMSW